MAIPASRATKTIRKLALSLPEAYEDAPWGFPVFKVADNKLFALMRTELLEIKRRAERQGQEA